MLSLNQDPMMFSGPNFFFNFVAFLVLKDLQDATYYILFP